MRVLDRKLWRDLWHLRGQALAIALVIVSGVAVYVMSLSTYHALDLTRAHFYRDYQFAQIFAGLKRAPAQVATRIAALPGVDRAEARTVATVKVRVEGFADPVIGQILSLGDDGTPLLNRLHLRRGRLVDPGRSDEVVVVETFADAHGLEPGDSLEAVINGRLQRLTIVGVVLSPEYVYQIAPGAFLPDYARFAVLWMAAKPLAAAYGMEGAFNHVALTLSGDVPQQEVIEALDAILAPYGGRGAYGREDQLSHNFLSEELRQLRTMAYVFPVIFLGVAAFLLNVVLSRLLALQREQIATLKAFGYGNLAVGLHFLKLVLVIVLGGIAGGIALGAWLGHALAGVYMEFYRFPALHFELPPWIALSAAAISAAAAALGTVHAIARAVRTPPAQAMRPEAPGLYRTTVLERIGLQRLFAQPTRMILRHLERRPFKALLTTVGIAFACGIMMVGNFQEGAIDFMMEVQFRLSQREDLTVTFTEPTAPAALSSLGALAGVEQAEGFRTVPVRLRFEHRTQRTALRGLTPEGRLQRVLDTELQPLALPPEGVVLTDYLAELLGVRPGQMLTVEVLEGSRPVRTVPVAGVTRQYLGVFAFMERGALNRLLGEGEALSGAYLAVDDAAIGEVFHQLHEMPRVVGIIVRETALRTFRQLMDDTILFFTFTATLLGAVIAFGVVYNSARITLSERSRELASLRVLGLTRGEVAYILLGELGLLTLLAIPLGFLIGYGLCLYLAANLHSELYRVPLVLERWTYATAAAVVLASSAVSGLVIWRKLGTLDLIAVLKTKE